MADSVEVGNLVVRLIADAKQLEAALKKSGADMKKFGDETEKGGKKAETSMNKAMKSIEGRLVGLASAFFSVNAVVSAFNNAVANVTALDNLSQATGVSIERLSELRNVALATGVDFNTLSQAMSQFGTRMTQGLASSTSQVSQAIRALNVDVRDAQGNIRQFDEILPELADRFAQFANGSNKAAIAAALFGEEAGPRMLALLNRGRAGLEEISRTLGTTYTAEDAERVRTYQTSLANLQAAFERATAALVTRFGPALTAIANAMARTIGPATRAQEAIRAWDDQLESVEAIERAIAAGRAGRHPADIKRLDETLARGRERLEQLRQEMVLALTPPTPIAGGPQAPVLDPFAMEKAQFALEKLQERLLGTRDIFDEVNLSWTAHGDLVTRTLAQINAVHEHGHRQEMARHRIETALRRQEQQQMLQTATVAAQAISAIWPKQKGAAIAAAIINTAVGVTNALMTGMPPWNIAQAAMIAAQGAAQIATIRSTNEDGSGGSAGPGGVAAAPAAPADLGRSLTIEGVDPAHMFSGNQVRGLIGAINEEVRNGATLISSGRLSS